MATRLLYQEDSYLKEFEARIVEVTDKGVILDKTAFHPGPHGGLDTDTGKLVLEDGRELEIHRADMLDDGRVVHITRGSLDAVLPGTSVKGFIDWDRRYRMMRLHTFSHILAAVLYEDHKAYVTGGHITPDYAKDDFSIESERWREVLEEAFNKSIEIASRCIEVKVYWMPREEAMKIPGIVKLMGRLPPEIEKLRIVEIPGVDIQADGGPHVRNTCEIGGVVITKMESKGRKRKRLYYALQDSIKPVEDG